MNNFPNLKDIVNNFYIKSVAKWLVYTFALIGFIFTAGYIAIKTGITNESGIIDQQQASFLNGQNQYTASSSMKWSQGDEWAVLENAIIKDAAAINRAANDANIDARLITALLVPEQLRLFHDNRELFKNVLAPLQIIVSQNQFSWGIMGIKQDTAIDVEKHLKDTNSPFYLGPEFENLLDFTSQDIGSERFARITNEKDHYYGYLYAAIYLKQIMKQWADAGFNISNRPEILATLYNIGFNNSRPNGNPQSGGASISINGKVNSFGSLAASFFYSDKLW